MRAVLVLLLLFATALGCTTQRPAQPAAPAPPAVSATPPPKSAAAPVIAPGDAKPGDRTLCLISDEIFVVEESSPKVEHGGKTYYFCCAGCDTDFKKDPEKYLKKLR